MNHIFSNNDPFLRIPEKNTEAHRRNSLENGHLTACEGSDSSPRFPRKVRPFPATWRPSGWNRRERHHRRGPALGTPSRSPSVCSWAVLPLRANSRAQAKHIEHTMWREEKRRPCGEGVGGWAAAHPDGGQAIDLLTDTHNSQEGPPIHPRPLKIGRKHLEKISWLGQTNPRGYSPQPTRPLSKNPAHPGGSGHAGVAWKPAAVAVISNCVYAKCTVYTPFESPFRLGPGATGGSRTASRRAGRKQQHTARGSPAGVETLEG